MRGEKLIMRGWLRLTVGMAVCLLCLSPWLVQADGDSTEPIIGTYTTHDQIYINRLGASEGKPLTSGFKDHKPVWSKTGSKIVFFRTKRNHYEVSQWRNAICVMNTDGSGFRELTGGEYHDFNPTWTRDGTNRIIFNRYQGNRWYIYLTDSEASPGGERLISDPQRSEYAQSSLKDGRILITSNRGGLKHYVFMLTPNSDKLGKYETVYFKYRLGGLPESASISPSEKRITYELNQSRSGFQYTGHPLVMADFDPETLTCTSPVVISRSRFDVCDLFPRWVKNESGIVYQSNRSGRYRFYLYSLNDKKTRSITTNQSADYSYFCGEESPY